MPLPNFIIAGAPKCGTTALWEILNQHPAVFFSPIKEPSFFIREKGTLKIDDQQKKPRGLSSFENGLDWYQRLFQNSEEKTAIGEASTVYFHNADSAFLIKQNIPNCRIIILLRDPVQQLYSYYWQNNRHQNQLPDFKEMFDKQSPLFQFLKSAAAYKTHLERWRAAFPPEQIKICLFDDLKNNPEKLLKDICDFLSIDNAHKFEFNKNYNPTVIPKNRLVYQISETAYFALKNILFKNRPPLRWQIKIRKINNWWIHKIGRQIQYPPLDPTLRAKLIPLFEEDIAYLEKLLNRDLSHWRKV